MRARHFITEYSREKTAQVHGANILTALNKNKTPGRDLDVWNLMTSSKDAMNLYNAEERADFMNKVMAQIEQGDPTKNKEYSQWIARMYSRGGYELEDIKSTLRDALETYHKLKLKKKLEADDKQIDKFTSFNDLITRVEQYPEIQDDAPTDKGDSKQIYDDEHIRVIVPKDEEAACYYGQGTRWCTASKNNNMFKHYHKTGDMYIILPKNPRYPGEKYQFHFHSGQFMDERDEPVLLQWVVHDYPSIRKVFTDQIKKFHIFGLMTDDELKVNYPNALKVVTNNAIKIQGSVLVIDLGDHTNPYPNFKDADGETIGYWQFHHIIEAVTRSELKGLDDLDSPWDMDGQEANLVVLDTKDPRKATLIVAWQEDDYTSNLTKVEVLNTDGYQYSPASGAQDKVVQSYIRHFKLQNQQT